MAVIVSSGRGTRAASWTGWSHFAAYSAVDRLHPAADAIHPSPRAPLRARHGDRALGLPLRVEPPPQGGHALLRHLHERPGGRGEVGVAARDEGEGLVERRV